MLDFSKAIQKSDIPVKLIKENIDRFAEILCKYFNESLEKSIFPDYLKLTNVTPVQKGCTYLKNNYRPLSILPILSKLKSFLEVYYQNFSVVLGKVMVTRIVF